MRLFGFVLISIALSISSCKSEEQVNDLTHISDNVRAYLFLSDSVEMDIEILDTLKVPDLEDLLSTIKRNIFLIGEDLDTLSLMIDDKAYTGLRMEQAIEGKSGEALRVSEDSLRQNQHILLEYQLRQAQLSIKEISFQQTKRILLHLKRGAVSDVAGYNVRTSYVLDADFITMDLLLDAQFTIVD